MATFSYSADIPEMHLHQQQHAMDKQERLRKERLREANARRKARERKNMIDNGEFVKVTKKRRSKKKSASPKPKHHSPKHKETIDAKPTTTSVFEISAKMEEHEEVIEKEERKMFPDLSTKTKEHRERVVSKSGWVQMASKPKVESKPLVPIQRTVTIVSDMVEPVVHHHASEFVIDAPRMRTRSYRTRSGFKKFEHQRRPATPAPKPFAGPVTGRVISTKQPSGRIMKNLAQPLQYDSDESYDSEYDSEDAYGYDEGDEYIDEYFTDEDEDEGVEFRR